MLLFSSQICPKFTPPSWADITTWWGRATACTTPWSTRTTRSCTHRTSGPAWVHLHPPPAAPLAPPLQLQHSSSNLLLSVTRRPRPLFQSAALDSCWLVARGSVNTALVLLNSVSTFITVWVKWPRREWNRYVHLISNPAHDREHVKDVDVKTNKLHLCRKIWLMAFLLQLKIIYIFIL